MSDVQKVTVGVQRIDAGSLVHFGPIVNGVVIPFASVRQGDYDEAVAAGANVSPSGSADDDSEK
jgi:hypothetical protein